ncbi:MAG: 4-hydroxy-tetrahydrodipicolinate reductase [Candidatus Eiseniibacteriota bacterium]|nr:MAG: 4-hydroxy-tetrahydrodipicolinate reductase [Candidatus Eisenbacteria bacterium]
MKKPILVSGICGRIGGKVAELVAGAPDLALAGGVEREGHPVAGSELSVGEARVRVARGFEDGVPEAELLVDFSVPEALEAVLRFCTGRGTALVCGTTGHSPKQTEMMRRASEDIAVLFSPNMSLGITVLNKLLPEVVRSLGPECDVELIEKHHRAKKDSPSGTALRLAATLAEACGGGKTLEVKYGREPGKQERKSGQLLIHSVRAGDIVGEHTVVTALRGERIEIKHVAESRDCFAHGTLAAVRFLLGRPPGWYTMEDVVSRPAG